MMARVMYFSMLADQLQALALVAALQIGHHLHGLQTIGDRHNDVLVLLSLVEEHIGDHRHGLCGQCLVVARIGGDGRLVHLFRELFGLHLAEAFLIHR
jgi:hypothetical protein